jgi:hypothetical protein
LPIRLRVGLDFPTIEVRYEHLSIDALAHVGSRGLPTFLNTTLNSLEVKNLDPQNPLISDDFWANFSLNLLFFDPHLDVQSLANLLHVVPNKKRPLNILNDVHGVIKPRR